jgi:hypothetical protein
VKSGGENNRKSAESKTLCRIENRLKKEKRNQLGERKAGGSISGENGRSNQRGVAAAVSMALAKIINGESVMTAYGEK